MSSGSYFTIYHRYENEKLDAIALNALKNEYFLAAKNDIFKKSEDENELKKDIPLLMDASFKANRENSIDNENIDSIDLYYDINGIKHVKLLDFRFGSSFVSLREHFSLNAYSYNRCSILISKNDAKKMLQAIEYVLSEEYSRKFESVLNNEYVDIFGNGYSLFDNRFNDKQDPIYVDKNDEGYVVKFSDHGYDAEIAESDNDIRFNLNKVKACLLAYLNAEDYWNGDRLVLEYSVW